MNTITDICECEDDVTCLFHIEQDARHWARVLGLSPLPYDASGAYEADDYRGRYSYGWDAA